MTKLKFGIKGNKQTVRNLKNFEVKIYSENDNRTLYLNEYEKIF